MRPSRSGSLARSRRRVVASTVSVLVALVLPLSAGCSAQDPASPTAGQLSGQSSPPITGSLDPQSGLPWISRSQLPSEAIDTLAEIAAGPPYPYDQDGMTFENREGILPEQDAAYYQEFTVVTPGSSDRGARRIIAGAAGERYYTDDHYASFARIAP